MKRFLKRLFGRRVAEPTVVPPPVPPPRPPAPPPFPPMLPDFFGPGRRAPLTQTGTVEISLPSTVDTGKFARYVPFGDDREVIVRRGTETGFQYGFERFLRRVKLQGGEFDLVTYESMLSPPMLRPGQIPTGDPEGVYRPISDVLYVPNVEVMIPRQPVRRGFTDEEVVRILAAIRVIPA